MSVMKNIWIVSVKGNCEILMPYGQTDCVRIDRLLKD